ncbi:uncharacterized protein F5891DRAFT_981471 [Suillus fuscotomentosus]|uniref:Uncharacterized protein n=1 Tax=Suillus fuscotomentosus TaxID=1912939 RepID=A0AAD4E4A9_9AGAM|nr:uncharacterized protein F5891DRAFT_981471 [Suillus fuscotomentosus]KAG1899087.1 hypothetical protein F5891DRAFT_981471 [Suillus fuscotomentosus]
MVTSEGRQQIEGECPIMIAQPLKRTYAIYMESDEESSDDEPPQIIEDFLAGVHSRYPAMNFLQYAGKLKDRGILYLPTATGFDIRFYQSKIGMPEGTALTFQRCASKAHMRVERAKERRKTKGKKKARARPHASDDNSEDK